MLFHLLYPPVNVVQYITFRTAAAGSTAFLISLLMGPWMIRTLREFQVGQVVRDELSETHQLKAGTPTMGGLLILAAALLPTLLWGDLTNTYIWVAMLSTAAFGFVGFLDDYLKIGRKNPGGGEPQIEDIDVTTRWVEARGLSTIGVGPSTDLTFVADPPAGTPAAEVSVRIQSVMW